MFNYKRNKKKVSLIYKRYFFVILCYILIIFYSFLTSPLYAHGVRGKIARGGIVIIAEYTTGEPMSYAKVVITAPDKKIPFQIGRTDRNGRFCFFPDMPGKWMVVVEDGMGHRLEMNLPVKHIEHLETSGKIEGSEEKFISKYLRIISGISIIFGIFGSIMGWIGYKKIKKENPAKGLK